MKPNFETAIVERNTVYYQVLILTWLTFLRLCLNKLKVILKTLMIKSPIKVSVNS